MTERSTPTSATRRAVIGGVGAVGAAALLAACGDDSDAQTQKQTGPVDLGKTTDIPVGGGKIFDDQSVVVTQPTAGDFKAFSAICTHQGCPVANISNGTINCTCHNSAFSIADGSVKHGPATSPLPAARIKVENGTITLS